MSASDFEEGTLLRKAVREMREHIAKTDAALADCQRDLVAVHEALPSWCGEGSLAERVARVVAFAEDFRKRMVRPIMLSGTLNQAAYEEWLKAYASFKGHRPIVNDVPLPDPRSLEDNGGGEDSLSDFELGELGGEGG